MTPSQSASITLNRETIDAIAEQTARRMLGLLGGVHEDKPIPQFVDAATLAGALGVDRSYIYAHADELGAIRLGDGPKPRLRFDLESAREAFTCYVSKRSPGQDASTGADLGTAETRHGRRLPNRLPQPGSILAVRPRGGGS